MRHRPDLRKHMQKEGETAWRIPRSYFPGMRTDAVIYAAEDQLEKILADESPQQVVNVATLPGIQGPSLAMPDIHWGYGFAIGGVCAIDPNEGGVISPGGVGYDINCGVRLMRTDLEISDVRPRLEELMDSLVDHVPAGVGRTGKFRFNKTELRRLMVEGPRVLKEQDAATDEDIDHTEATGQLAGADADAVGERALDRGTSQCGTLGGGNHFLEVDVVEEIHDEEAARLMGLAKGTVCVLIHSGSRGLGHQVCEDSLRSLRDAPERYGITLPDRQLACAPIESAEGQKYLGAMAAAANFAWCNRQLLMHGSREAFQRIFGGSADRLGLRLVYDVAHNIAKAEPYTFDGEEKTVWVHRKGATRAFPPHHPEIPRDYQPIGQPVLIPGDMQRASWVLLGRQGSMDKTFGTTCHGAGRAMSRKAAVRAAGDRRIDQEMAGHGIVARARSHRGLKEEQGAAYKDVDTVVNVVQAAGLSAKVAKLRPIGVLKG